jgi:hypothetical protein
MISEINLQRAGIEFIYTFLVKCFEQHNRVHYDFLLIIDF